MHLTTLSFDLRIKEHQIPGFKQAVLNIEGLDHGLYNNKKKSAANGKIRYPPIHYRALDGYAILWGMDEGARQLESDLKNQNLQNFVWQGKERSFSPVRHFNNASETAEYLGPEQYKTYRIRNYLPLSNHTGGRRKVSTYDEYEKAADYTEKTKILERVLVSHLLLFNYATDWQLTSKQRLKAIIVDKNDISEGVYKKGKGDREKRFKKFDLDVKLNARLPDGIALGNLVSLGYGVLEALPDGG